MITTERGDFVTVGEKIQYYRKKSGLSQDELGQRLMVSRQTVSLWEMDKTLPTVDNLLRLKEIFGVSVDDILNGTEPHQEVELETLKPRECYLFQYTESEVQDIYKKPKKALIVRNVIILLWVALLFVLSIISGDSVDLMILVGIVLVFVSLASIKVYIDFVRTTKVYQSRLLEQTYRYEVYDTYFTVEIERNGEVIGKSKLYLSEIERVQDYGAYLVMQYRGLSYFLRKRDLDPQSVYYQCRAKIAEQAKKSTPQKPSHGLSIASIVLMFASIATILGAAVCLALMTAPYHVATENMWVFFLFTPIPIASVIFGLYLKNKGYKYKKNVITGIIMTVLLCLYGCFTFIFASVYSHDDAPIVQVESFLDTDIPTPLRINTRDWTGGVQSVQRGYVYSVSDVYFNSDAAADWEAQLNGDQRWLEDFPSDLVGITSSVIVSGAYDYVLICNVQTGEINTLPEQNGTYRFVSVLYNSAHDTMQIVEYEIEYIK